MKVGRRRREDGECNSPTHAKIFLVVPPSNVPMCTYAQLQLGCNLTHETGERTLRCTLEQYTFLVPQGLIQV